MSEVKANYDSVIKLTTWTKITKIFTEPAAVFENLRVYPDWIIPVLLTLLVGFSTVYLTVDIQKKTQQEFILNSEQIPEEQKDEILEGLEDQSFVRTVVVPAAGLVFWVFASYAVAALAFMAFGNFIYGGKATFVQNFALYSWAGLIGVLEGLIKLPLFLSKGSFSVYTSLAILLDPGESKTLMFKIFNAVDIFSIWKIIVWSIGFSVIYKFSKGKSYTAIIILFLIYTVISISISQMFGGFGN